MRLHRTTPALLLALTVAACDTNDPSDPAVSGVVVVNQGNFSQGNGSLSTYDPEARTAVAAAVTGFASTLQSALATSNRLYVTADKAGRLDRFLASSLARDGAALGELRSARYAAAGNARLYVTAVTDTLGGFSGGSVNVLDAAATRIVKRILLPMAAEGVAVSSGKAFVALHGFGAGRDVAVIQNDILATTLTGVCDGPRSLFADGDGDVNVLCTGTTTYDANYNVTGQTNGSVVVIDGTTGTVKARADLGAPAGATNSGQDGYLDRTNDALYVVVGRTVRVFNTDANTLSATPVATTTQDIGAVAYDADRKQLHVALYPSSNPFTAAGSVAVYDLSRSPAIVEATYTVGIAPTFIAFR